MNKITTLTELSSILVIFKISIKNNFTDTKIIYIKIDKRDKNKQANKK